MRGVADPENYDEFGLFHENAEEYGVPWNGPPTVRRESVPVAHDGRRVSALVWGRDDPELVLLHGGGQNAHTWDTVALALDRALVAIDLPCHGHSDYRETGPFDPRQNAADVAVVIRALAPDARMVVGMSLGGLTNIALCTHAPELVRKAVLVDVTPGVDNEKGSAIGQFLAGPESFESFDEILSRTIEYNPTRTESSLRRGVLHNALRRPDGRWVWRHQQVRPPDLDQRRREIDFKDLWPDVSLIAVPVMLLRGMAQGSVIDDADEAEFLRRQPNARVEHVEGAGHSLQGDQPVETARLLADFLDS